MLFYYRWFGFAANIALFANVVLITGFMSLLGATLTLPGIAGIVLTIGMAVDANVLIFSRIREELKDGKDPQTAIQEGFSRAFVTIVDANVTTLIINVVTFASTIVTNCLLYTSPSPRDKRQSRMPSSA